MRVRLRHVVGDGHFGLAVQPLAVNVHGGAADDLDRGSKCGLRVLIGRTHREAAHRLATVDLNRLIDERVEPRIYNRRFLLASRLECRDRRGGCVSTQALCQARQAVLCRSA